MRYILTLANILLFLVVFSQDRNYLYPYRKGNLWGYCNKEKKIIIPIKYQETTLFDDSFALVKIKNKWGVIDKNENVIVSPKYKNATYLEDKTIFLKDGNCYNFKGERTRCFATCGGGVSLFSFGSKYKYSNGKEGFCFIKEGNVPANMLHDTFPGLYDKIIACGWAKLLLVEDNNKWGIVNDSNKIILELKYDTLYHNYLGRFFIVKQNNLLGFANQKGEIIQEPIFKKIFYEKKEIVRVVTVDDKLGYMGLNGNKYFED